MTGLSSQSAGVRVLTQSRKSKQRGQTVVEFALLLPVLVLLMLIALDFGRAFLGWVSLNSAARVGANYAALHPNDAWGPGTNYQILMTENMGAINCTPNPDPPAAPVFGPTGDPGELVRVNLSCDFQVLTPIIGAVVGDTVTMSSSAAFPITSGCLAECEGGVPPPPPPAPDDNCRTVPDTVGMSVAGARRAWAAAGFPADQFDPATGDDTRTVESQAVAEAPNTEGCAAPERFFNSTMTVTLEPTDPVVAGCNTVPNLVGVPVADARSSWTAAGFTGSFLPTTSDTRIVLSQVTDPPSDPGDCMPPVTAVVVSHGPPPPAPPPQPCLVPSFVNTSSASANGTWSAAGFTGVLSTQPKNQSFTVQAQSLVGGTYVSCAADITVYKNANQNP